MLKAPKIASELLFFIVHLCPPFAQIQNSPDSLSNLRQFFGMFGGFMLISLGIFVIHIVILIWVAQDAKARGMDDVVLWLIAVFLISIGGLIVYLILRPKGNLTVCSNCSNKRLEGSATCPHCRRE